MREPGPADVGVVIPTQNRWSVLAPTIDALRRQTVGGFEVVVVVDRGAEPPPFLAGATVVERHRPGVASARNQGVAATHRRVVLLLGDDTIPEPDLIERHLAVHRRCPAPEVGVLGAVHWHRDVARGRLQRWLEWSGTQFDYRTIEGEEAGWGRLYSSNVSLKREFLVDAGGFDEEFLFGYEDTELGLRLHDRGLRLLYEPQARVWHLHRYDWAAIERRFLLVGGGEQVMVRKHPDFPPQFLTRLTAHRRVSTVSLWPWLVDYVPARAGRIRRAAEVRADAWYAKRLAPAFVAGWLAAEELDDAGEDLDRDGRARAERFEQVAWERLAEQRWLGDLLPHVPPGSRLLTVGCSTTVGVALAACGFRLTFVADGAGQAEILRRRLERRGLTARVLVGEPAEVWHDDEFDVAAFLQADRAGTQHVDVETALRCCSLVAVSFGRSPATRAPAIEGVERARGRSALLRRRYPDGSRLHVYRGERPRLPAGGGSSGLRARAKTYAGRWLGRRAWVPPHLSSVPR